MVDVLSVVHLCDHPSSAISLPSPLLCCLFSSLRCSASSAALPVSTAILPLFLDCITVPLSLSVNNIRTLRLNPTRCRQPCECQIFKRLGKTALEILYIEPPSIHVVLQQRRAGTIYREQRRLTFACPLLTIVTIFKFLIKQWRNQSR